MNIKNITIAREVKICRDNENGLGAEKIGLFSEAIWGKIINSSVAIFKFVFEAKSELALLAGVVAKSLFIGKKK